MARVIRDEAVATVTGAPRAMASAGAATRVEVRAVEEAAAAPVVPAPVATAAVVDLMDAVGDATGGAKSGRSAPRKRATSSPSVPGVRVWPLGEHIPIGRGGAGDRAADVPRGYRRESSGVRGEGTGKCSVMVGRKVRDGELGKQVVKYIADMRQYATWRQPPTVLSTIESAANP